MDSLFLIGILLVGICAILIILRSPMPAVFLSLISGKLFAEQLTPHIQPTVDKFISVSDSDTISAVLLLLPVVITIVLLQGKVTHSKLLINSVGMVLTGAALLIFLDPYTGIMSKINVADISVINSYKDFIVSGAAGFAVILTWLTGGLPKRKKHK